MAKKIIAVLALAAALCAPAAAKVAEISYLKNGVYAGKISTYNLGDSAYLNAAQAAKAIGGKIYWYPVSGKLLLQIKGNKVVFFMKSDSVLINDEDASFPNPLIVRGGKAFIALDFFTSKYFARAFGFRLEYNEKTAVLSAQRDVNVTSVNFYSYQDKTRIVIYMEQPLEWQSSQKENNLVSLTIPSGVLYAEEKIAIGDGVVRGVDLVQENKMARIVVSPDANFGKADMFRLTDPDRIVIDVTRRANSIPQGIGQETPAEAEILPAAGRSAGLAGGAAASAASAAAGAAGAGAKEGLNIPDKLTDEKGERKRIVVDAGHGGKDPGGKKLFGLKEKEMNLAVANELYELLRSEDRFEVLRTRSSDEFIPLAERSGIANSYKADLFVSIHGNASRDRREKGFEVYFMSEKASDPGAAETADYENSVIGLEGAQTEPDPAAMLLHSMARNEYQVQGGLLAGLVASELEKRTPFANRGVKQAAFYVLRGTYSPGVLVEMGFMTNSSDQKNLNDKKVRTKIATAIYKGILKYAEMKQWK